MGGTDCGASRLRTSHIHDDLRSTRRAPILVLVEERLSGLLISRVVERVGKRTAVHPPVLRLAVARIPLGSLSVADGASRSAPDPGPSGPHRRVHVRPRFDAGILAR